MHNNILEFFLCLSPLLPIIYLSLRYDCDWEKLNFFNKKGKKNKVLSNIIFLNEIKAKKRNLSDMSEYVKAKKSSKIIYFSNIRTKNKKKL